MRLWKFLLATSLIVSLFVSGARPDLLAQNEITSSSPFKVKFGRDGVVSLKYAHDKYDTEYIAPYQTLGHITIRYRMGENEWQEFSTRDPKNKYRQLSNNPLDPWPQLLVVYNESGWNDYYADIELTQRFRIEGNALYWTIHPRNLTHKPIVLGDVILSLPFNTEKRWDKEITYTQRVHQHLFVSGHNSFLFWMRPNSEGPYLVMIPVFTCPLFEPAKNERNFTPAKLEYFDRNGVFIHSGKLGEEMRARGGNWRQPQTMVTLSPKFSPNDEITWIFKFRWANDYDEIRQILYEEGLLDIQVVPGMTIPLGLEAMISIRTKSPIRSIVPEFPQQTQIEDLGEKAKDTRIYRVKFSRLGENKLTVNFGRNLYMILEFFVTEPIATLIKKRAAFLVSKQQHRDPSKWYNGLFSEWDMRAKVLRSPDDTGGLLDYIVACDDPGLCKAPFVAGKNVDYPMRQEIEAVEYYLKNFVWGKLQMTDKEKYPYAIYGIDNWKKNRDSGPQDRDGWIYHVWRVFDYPHVIHLYWNMYRVAKFYPELVSYLDKEGYLERAYGTAMAFYTVPEQVAGWSANDVGNYDELVIADLIEELYAVGWKEKAEALQAKWEEKVRHFIKNRPNLFHSEYPFDPTGFESHHAFARYAVEKAKQGDNSLKISLAEAEDFMREEIAGNLVCRGWLETSYWQLGVEGSMRYMSQMGGWAILDYALYYAPDPFKYLRLGYASILSSWALMNTGTPETNYGYWYPGKENDGAAGSAFVSQAYGRSWIGVEQPRGAWPYSAEIDLGYGAYLRAAATVVAEDPLFGLFVYGGQLKKAGNKNEVIPMDGLGRRFHLIRGNLRFHLLFDHNGFASNRPIIFDDDLSEISFVLENRAPVPAKHHQTEMKLLGLPDGKYQVLMAGQNIQTISGGKTWQKIRLPIGAKKEITVLIKKLAATK
ncbi:MAG: DUF5695 domain-containing protein [Candidatus Aminicenantes bacterium]|nr:DUF5695 domain-containing protein [Candidatus Aminicenantes bacterium]